MKIDASTEVSFKYKPKAIKKAWKMRHMTVNEMNDFSVIKAQKITDKDDRIQFYKEFFNILSAFTKEIKDDGTITLSPFMNDEKTSEDRSIVEKLILKEQKLKTLIKSN